MESTIRLFKALPVNSDNISTDVEKAMSLTLPFGFVFDAKVLGNYADVSHLVTVVNDIYGRGSEELNQTFHKSFAKVRDASIQQLVIEQIIHYMTTYGAEAQGVYDVDNVYIPAEELNIPELKEGFKVVIIRGLTKAELKDKVLELLATGIALKEQTVSDVMDVIQLVGFDRDDVELIKNKEVKAALYDHLGIVPTSPVEFLRFVVYKASEKTLLIKNPALVETIKARKNTDITKYFDLYADQVGLENLAQIFYRYKPLFLAFRTNTMLKKHINRVRRLAVSNHEPMQEDLLNTITARLQHNDAPDLKDFGKALDNANIFRKIRLAYALKFRTTDADSILYKVRNGKSYAKEFSFSNPKGAEVIYNVILQSIVNDISPKVNGKKVYIPENIKYALPATEKQFTGNLPSGTCVEVPNNMVAGVHWVNEKDHRTDLDLSISNAEGKIGWDGRYRDREQGVYFSGDIVDAPRPKGATEVFHIGSEARGTWIMFVNYYNFQEGFCAPFRIVVGAEDRGNVEKGYTVDPNKLVAFSNTEINVKQKNLGIIVADEVSTKFYFSESELGNSITHSDKEYAEQARKYLVNYNTSNISLNNVIVQAGAELVDNIEDADIDLSIESIDKATIIDLLTKE